MSEELEKRLHEAEKEIERLNRQLEKAEKEILSQALDNYGSTRAIARVLKVSQPTIVRKLNKYGLTTEKQ